MRQSIFAAMMVCLATLGTVVHAQQDGGIADIEGTWAGVLDEGAAGSTRVFFTFTRAANGTLSGVADDPAKSTSVPMDRVTLSGSNVHLEVSKSDVVFEGTWNATPPTINGQLTQHGMTFKLQLVPATLVKPARPQEPKPPFPYVQEDVHYEDAASGVSFAGTLTRPRRWGRLPAVLLITGSGQQNRDEELFEHKPFLLIADTLTRRGIAVLRVDDRGVGGTTAGADLPDATTADFIDDARRGVAYLKSRSDIDASRIGLIGHSEGGVIAPAVATLDDIAFIALLAGPGVRGAEVLKRQVERSLAVTNLPEDFRTFWASLYSELIEISLSEPDAALARQRMASHWEQKKAQAATSTLSDQAKALVPAFDPTAQQVIQNLVVPWMRYFLAYDPQPVLRQVQCPVLAMNGDLDVEVDAKQNLPAIQAALEEAGDSDVTIAERPGLNHLFQTAKTGDASEYPMIEETFAPSALQQLSDWVVEHAQR